MNHISCLSLLALLSWASVASSWNSPGHEGVGYIADQILVGTNTAKDVRKILGTNLKTASVWADCAKGVTHSKQTGKFSYTVNPKYQECAPYETPGGQKLMKDYVARNWDNCNPAEGEDPCHKQYHYTDVSIEHNSYSDTFKGTSDHDIAHAIGAAIIVLQGGESPAPFQIANKKEALRLLAHYIGDIHQPLHVGAIYLDASGDPVDPDRGVFDPNTRTQGGNQLLHGSSKMHAEWDGIPAVLTPDKLTNADIDEARAIPVTTGDLSSWPMTWATETLLAGRTGFQGITFAAENVGAHTWSMKNVPNDYSAQRRAIQRQQELKAGARLAQVLIAIFP